MATSFTVELNRINRNPSLRLQSGAGEPPTSGGTPAFSFAAPGGAVNGQAIIFSTDGTISFGTKSTSALALFENFQEVPENTLLKDTDPLWRPYVNGGPQKNGAPVVSSGARYFGSKSAINDLRDHPFATNSHAVPLSDYIYVKFQHKFVGAFGVGVYGVGKLPRVTTNQSANGEHYNGPGTHSITNFNPQPPAGEGGYLAYTNSANEEIRIGYMAWDFVNWNTVEYEFKLNTPGVADGIVRLWVNGALIYNITNANQRAAGNTMQFNSVLLGLDMANATGEWSMLQGDTYADVSSRRMICVGNKPTYAASTIRESQPWDSWSSNSISCLLNRGAISSDAWAFYVDDNNVQQGDGAYLGRA